MNVYALRHLSLFSVYINRQVFNDILYNNILRNVNGSSLFIKSMKNLKTDEKTMTKLGEEATRVVALRPGAIPVALDATQR